MFFQFWNEILRFPSLKLKPQSQKHTCYTIKCMFLAQGLFCEKACLDHANCVKTYILHCKMYVFYNSGMIFQDSKIEIEAPESKTYILHCKMYVFFNFGMKFQGSKPEIEAPESKTYILHCKMYVFSILGWNFKVPNLKLKPQSQKHTFYTVTCMFFQFWNEFSRFQTWNWSPRIKNIHFTL